MRAHAGTPLKQGEESSLEFVEPLGPRSPCSDAGQDKEEPGSTATSPWVAGEPTQIGKCTSGPGALDLSLPSLQAGHPPPSFEQPWSWSPRHPEHQRSRAAAPGFAGWQEESRQRHYKTSPAIDLIRRAGTEVTITHTQSLDKTRQVMPELCQERSRR